MGAPGQGSGESQGSPDAGRCNRAGALGCRKVRDVKESCAGTGGSRTWGRCEERGEGSRDAAKGKERSPGVPGHREMRR